MHISRGAPHRLVRKLHMRRRMERPGVAAEARTAVVRWIQRVEVSSDLRLEVLREGSRPPGECRIDPGVATCGPGSHLTCPCDARVHPQQSGCGVTLAKLCASKRTSAELQLQGGVWGRQAGQPTSLLCEHLTTSFARGSTPGVARRRAKRRGSSVLVGDVR